MDSLTLGLISVNFYHHQVLVRAGATSLNKKTIFKHLSLISYEFNSFSFNSIVSLSLPNLRKQIETVFLTFNIITDPICNVYLLEMKIFVI